MKAIWKWAFAICIAFISVWSGNVRAESQYGYEQTGTSTAVVTATARVNLSVQVPKLILLRVGTAGSTQDTVTFTVSATVPASTSATTGNNTAVTWDGTAPIFSSSASGNAVAAYAWTNTASASYSCSVTGFPAGGIALADFTVAAVVLGGGTNLPHVANLGSCASTQALTAGTLYSSTWTYSLGGTPTGWTPGTYTGNILYTATGQ